jgi:hypothetical protein
MIVALQHEPPPDRIVLITLCKRAEPDTIPEDAATDARISDENNNKNNKRSPPRLVPPTHTP